MPANLQAVLVLLLFVLPGFVAVEVDAATRPARERSLFDKTAWSVFYSTLVHVLLLPASTWLGIRYFGLDLAQVDEGWFVRKVRHDLLLLEVCVEAYFLASAFLGGLLGWSISRFTRHRTPVWTRAIVQRVMPRGWSRWLGSRRARVALSVLVKMRNGDQYAGILDKIPGDYDILQGKDKDFSITKVVHAVKDKRPIRLPPDEIVLLNTANVDSLHLAEEPLSGKR